MKPKPSLKQREESSRSSDEQLQALIESVPMGIGITDQAGNVLAYNRVMMEYGGYGLEDAREIRHVSELYQDPKQRDEVLTIFAREGIVKNFPVQFKRRDGSAFDALLSLTPTTFTGRPCVQALVEDITERKRAEEAEVRGRLVMEQVQALARLGSWEIDLDANRVTASPEARRIYGLSQDVMTLPAVQAATLPEYRSVLDAALAALITGGAAYDAEFKVRRPTDGVVRDIHSVAEYDPASRRVSGYVQDITERKQAEEKNARLEAQLQQAQKLESVGRLAGGVAHDFNNMLGVIIGHAEMALEQVTVAEPLHADLTAIRASAHRSADLTRQLLAFARKQTIVPKALDLNEIVAVTLKMLRRLIGEEISVDWRPGTALWPVMVDPSQIDQILANLFVNARDAISGVGTIAIETGNVILSADECADVSPSVPGEYVRLVVRDSGRGMDADTLARIFEPFFTTKGVGEGTGLGLSTVYGAVQQNRGAIKVQSAPGSGTTFTIYLPRLGEKDAHAPAELRVNPVVGGRETVLVVEDEPDLLNIVTATLERRGYTVLATNSPGVALDLARQHAGEIRLLITDVVMPQMDGRALAQRLAEVCPRVKHLFMSGYTADIITSHGVLDDGVSFLEKPFTGDALAAKVRDTLDGDARS